MFLFLFLLRETEITYITVYLPESFKWVYVWVWNKCTARLYNMTVIKRKKTRSWEEKRDYSVGDPGQFYCTPISPNPRRNLKIKMSEEEIRTYIIIYIYLYKTCRYGLRTCRFTHKTLALALRMMFYEHRGLNSLSPMSTVNISHRL